MARPRKDSDQPEARERLHNAFWMLLESNELHEITVGIIATKAECNRGTFYYHYHDIEELIASAIEEEFLQDDAIPTILFYLVTGVNKDRFESALKNMSGRIYHLSLLLDKGGMDEVYAAIKALIINIWQTILCAEGEELTLEARRLIEYSVNGMIGVVTYEMRRENGGDLSQLSGSTFSNTANYMITQICDLQNISKEEVVARITLAGQLNGFLSA